MAAEGGSARPHILLHRVAAEERAPVAELIERLGARWSTSEGVDVLAGQLAGDGLDLALADADALDGEFDAFLRPLADRASHDPLPLILLADAATHEALAERIAGLFPVVILAKPPGRACLASVLRSSLALRANQRQARGLLDRLREANAELERRRREAEAQRLRQVRFLSAISHDIRTPINAIVLFSHLMRESLREPVQAADWERLVEGVAACATALTEQLDDLLDIARFDLGKLRYEESTFPLRTFLEEALGATRLLADQKRLDFRVAVDPPRAAARTDAAKLARVLQNLASNAVKFTDAGEVVVSARATADGRLVLAVADTGRGIPPEQHESVFDEFSQIDNPERNRLKGTGLGLAISRRLAQVLGGRIDLDSAPGRGSTFTLTLPPGSAPPIPDPG